MTIKLNMDAEMIKSKPHRISEMVWASVLSIAVAHNAHAKVNEDAGDEGEAGNLISKKDLKDLKEGNVVKDQSALNAMMAGAADQGNGVEVEDQGQVANQEEDEQGQDVDHVAEGKEGLPSEAELAAQVEADLMAQAGSATGADDVHVAAAHGNESLSDVEFSASHGDSFMVAAAGTVVSDAGTTSVAASSGAGYDFSAGLLAVLGVGAIAVAAAAGGGGGGDGGDGDSGTSSQSGTAIDGYIAGATVYYDANGNGTLDEGEVSTTTDNQGNFTLSGYTVTSDGMVVVKAGGTDVLTGETITSDLVADVSSSGEIVVSPFTTLLASGVDEAALKTALGIDQSVDLSTYDPIANLSSDDPAVAAAAESILVAAQQVMTVLQATVATGDDLETAATNLATAINEGATSLDAAVDTALGDNTELADAINNVNASIEESMGGGNLIDALASGSAAEVINVLGAVAVAQSGFISAVEDGNELGETWADADYVQTQADEYTPTLTEGNYEFLIDNGLSLDGAEFEVTDSDMLTQLLNDGALDDGLSITVDDGILDDIDDATWNDINEQITTGGGSLGEEDLGDY